MKSLKTRFMCGLRFRLKQYGNSRNHKTFKDEYIDRYRGVYRFIPKRAEQ